MRYERMEGRIGGRYRVRRELGGGGMGHVYEVEDAASGAACALKVLAAGGERQREKLLRFRREFRAASRLVHPNVVRVHEFVSGRVSFYTMEYVDGADVASYFGVGSAIPASRVARGALNRPERVRRLYSVLHQVLLALEHMHASHVIHRDLKPENILIVETGERFDGEAVPLVKLMDFGLARDLRETVRLTQPGVVLGTLAYLSPEQAMGRAIDGRTDLYALGVILYRLLTGTLPFAPDTVPNMLWQHCTALPEPPRARNPGVDRYLDSVCMRLLRKEPAERFQTASELLLALQRTGTGGYGLPEVVVAACAGRGLGPVRPLFAPRLVGRDRELAELVARLEGVAAGAPSAAITLIGPMGSGRTRLVEALQERARARDHEIVCGRFDGSASGWTRVVRELERLLGRAPGAPRGRLPAGPRREEEPEAAATGADAFLELISAQAGRRPLLVVLEDVERAPPGVLSTLESLSLALADPPGGPGALIVITARAGSPAAASFERLAGKGTAHTMSLPPLGTGHVALVVTSILGQEEGLEDLADRVGELAQGLPSLAVELTRLAVHRGAVRFRGRWRVEPGDLAELAASRVEDLVAEAVASRVAGLDAGARAFLAAAARLGEEFELEEAMELGALGENVAVDAVEELLRARLLRERESSLAFDSELVLEAARRLAGCEPASV